MMKAFSDITYVQRLHKRYRTSGTAEGNFQKKKKSLEIYFRGKVINERTNLPGKRCMRTLTILSSELKTKLQRQTISAHANGPCRHI